MNTRENRTDGTDWVIPAAIAATATIAFIVWKFSTALGLDMPSGANVLLRLVVLTALVVVSLKFGDEFEIIQFQRVWPLFLVGLWMCFWPALDFWAQHGSPFASEEPWWDHWILQWPAAILVSAGWIGYRIWKSESY
jgi:hypothetical protein